MMSLLTVGGNSSPDNVLALNYSNRNKKKNKRVKYARSAKQEVVVAGFSGFIRMIAVLSNK